MDIIDVVDDVPSVAVTLNTNDFGDVKTLAVLAQLSPAKLAMNASATSTNANLVAGSTYLHGVALADFAVTCGNLTGVTLWAPVQDECSIGTLANNIDQTLFLDKVYVNSLEFSYTTGANATENYGAETDNKMWLLNAGRFVNYEAFDVTASGIADGYVDLSLASTADIAVLSTGIGFLRKSTNGSAAVTFYDASANTMTNVEIVKFTGLSTTSDVAAASATTYVYRAPDPTDTDPVRKVKHRVYLPTGSLAPALGDKLQVVYSANAYAGSTNKYFKPLEEPTDRPDSVGAVRQGQIEVYIVDPDAGSSYDTAWRLTGVTISADLTREPLLELGHLAPYDRPLTLPIPITSTVESTAGDLENWAKFAGKAADFVGTSMTDLALKHLMNKENLVLVVKVYQQTDEEAGGTGVGRKVIAGSSLVGEEYFNDGVMAIYSAGDTERALKTIVLKNLKITDEGMTLDLGSNATQTFGFRSTNDLFVIKGDISYGIAESEILRNA